MRAVAIIFIGGVLCLVAIALVAASLGGALAGYGTHNETWLPLLYGAPTAVIGFFVAQKGKRGIDTAS